MLCTVCASSDYGVNLCKHPLQLVTDPTQPTSRTPLQVTEPQKVPFPSSAARPRSTADFATRASFSLNMLAAAAAGVDTALLDGAADGELLDRMLLMRGSLCNACEC
jgi:hypothetical protein